MIVKTIGLVAVKNEEQYMGKLLCQLTRLTDLVLVADDASTDNTKKICESFAKVRVHTLPDLGYWHTGRNRVFLHSWAMFYEPEWVVTLDADELWKDEDVVAKLLDEPKDRLCYTFPLLYLWNDEKHCRWDKFYPDIKAIRVFKFNSGDFPRTEKAHATSVPVGVRNSIGEIDSPILHYGYITKEERQKKFDYYSKRRDVDYSHIIDENVILKELQ